MIFTSANLNIRSDSDFGQNGLYFEFKGKFTKDVSAQATQAWTSELSKTGDHYTFIWDCSNMNGFEPSARTEWYKGMKACKGQIDSVIVISDRILIRGAARVMLELFGVRNTIVKKKEELLVDA